MADPPVITTDTLDVAHLLAAAEDSVWIPFDTEGIVQRVDGRRH